MFREFKENEWQIGKIINKRSDRNDRAQGTVAENCQLSQVVFLQPAQAPDGISNATKKMHLTEISNAKYFTLPRSSSSSNTKSLLKNYKSSSAPLANTLIHEHERSFFPLLKASKPFFFRFFFQKETRDKSYKSYFKNICPGGRQLVRDLVRAQLVGGKAFMNNSSRKRTTFNYQHCMKTKTRNESFSKFFFFFGKRSLDQIGQHGGRILKRNQHNAITRNH